MRLFSRSTSNVGSSATTAKPCSWPFSPTRNQKSPRDESVAPAHLAVRDSFMYVLPIHRPLLSAAVAAAGRLALVTIAAAPSTTARRRRRFLASVMAMLPSRRGCPKRARTLAPPQTRAAGAGFPQSARELLRELGGGIELSLGVVHRVQHDEARAALDDASDLLGAVLGRPVHRDALGQPGGAVDAVQHGRDRRARLLDGRADRQVH